MTPAAHMVIDSPTDGSLDDATVRERVRSLYRHADDQGLAELLTRYLSKPCSDSETAWASMNLANVFACGGRPADAVLTHEAFERWLPGRSPRLSARPPYYPASADSPDLTIGSDEIRVTFLGQSVQFATSYGAVGRYDEFVHKADAALSALAPTSHNLRVRFYGQLIFLTASQLAGDFERAERRLLEMRSTADQADDPARAAELHALIVTYEIQLARARNDTARVAERLQHALSLLAELEKNGSSRSDLRGYRFELAHHLIGAGRHELALPLLDDNLAEGGHGDHGYGWLMHAAAVWTGTGDRARTLGLLRDARNHDGRDLTADFRGTPGFDDVRDDPEFLQAISR